MKYPNQSTSWLFVLLLSWGVSICSFGQDISEKTYQLGIEARDLGDYAKAIKLFKQALTSKDTLTFKKQYEIYNEIGIAKQKVLELDSSSYYFRNALSFLNKATKTPQNQYYLPGILKNRIGLNEFNTGKMQASILSMKEAITSFQKYVNEVSDEKEKQNGLKKQYASVDNLGGFYRGLGENERGLDLAKYSYQQKLSFLEEDDPNITISRLILGHINLISRNHEEAGAYLDQGLEHIEKVPYLKTYALMVRASIYENVNDFQNAQQTYEECERVYRESANGNYSLVFLDALIEMSRFYAKIGHREKAIALAEEGYQFTQSETFTNELIAFYHIQNLSQVHFTLKNYEEALNYSNEALQYFSSEGMDRTQTQLDSIRNEIRKPSVLYLKTKSSYFLNKSKDPTELESLLKETKEALSILERQKTNINTEEDLATLLADNSDLIDFTKQLYWNLYELTGKEEYLDHLISLHESAIYTRIRSRLNLKKVEFASIPENVLNRESELKKSLISSLDNSGHLDDFFLAQAQWNSFLDSLKTNYPAYHHMRYASIQEPVDGIREQLDPEVTVVRYLFIEEALFAFVLTPEIKTLIPIKQHPDLSKAIQKINSSTTNFNSVASAISELYDTLWKPLTHLITTENIIIIPDGVLFNLSFDLLTPSLIGSYQELGNNSLLAHHNISYNYSLFLVNNETETSSLKDNFVSFAPEFNAEMKNAYRKTVLDSVNIDNTYLSLLPQPFSVEIVKKFASKFNGTTYLNESSTKRAFTENAQSHKIIHIATHAESNNLNPEFSRLIFAKDAADSLSNNYLHTYEIYNHNLSSLLTTLTACETGKPSFQPGEGMISLAHAFNYAGSQSILTSLWKIDEQSSTEIVELFYSNLASGLNKDNALRKAKLEYLANAQGRTQAPFYWSGLILMGDTYSIPLQSNLSIWAWAVFILVGLLLLWALFKRKKNYS